jgi:hypothetical protein
MQYKSSNYQFIAFLTNAPDVKYIWKDVKTGDYYIDVFDIDVCGDIKTHPTYIGAFIAHSNSYKPNLTKFAQKLTHATSNNL